MKTCPNCQNQCSDETRFCANCGEPVEQAEEPSPGQMTGKVIAGNFRLQEMIGSGAMGAIYKAEQISLGKVVVIKLLHRHLLSDPTLNRRFHREARAASRLNHHPNCITIHDFGQAENGALFIAMEYIEGADLAEALYRDHPLRPERITSILKQVCLALDEAHAQGIIHRDLKPENIMLSRDRQTGGDTVKVLDFGIAKIQDRYSEKDASTSWQTVAGVVCGTPEYMAPEQSRGEKLDARADLYSLGVILFQLLTNKLPFTGDSPIAVVTRHLTDPVPNPDDLAPGLQPDLVRLAAKLMSKSRDGRLESAMAVHAELDRIENAVAGDVLVGVNRRRVVVKPVSPYEDTNVEVRAMPEGEPEQSSLAGLEDAGTTGHSGAFSARALRTAPPVGTEALLEAQAGRASIWPWVSAAVVGLAAGGVLMWYTQIRAGEALPGAPLVVAVPLVAPFGDGAVHAGPADSASEPDEAAPDGPKPAERGDRAARPSTSDDPAGKGILTTARKAEVVPAAELLVAGARGPEDATAAEKHEPEPLAAVPAEASAPVAPPAEERREPKAHVRKPDPGPPRGPDRLAAAREWVSKAEDAKRAGNNALVVTAYQSAYDILRRPAFLKEIGMAYKRLGKLPQACTYFQKYVSRLPARKRPGVAQLFEPYGCMIEL